MMRRKLILGMCIVLGFLSENTCRARLGESAAESGRRYGAMVIEGRVQTTPLHENALEIRYHYKGWRIRAAYVDDSTIIISYTKLAPADTSEGELFEDEIEAILKAESRDHLWQQVPRATKLTTSEKYQKYFDNASRLWKNPNGSVAWISRDFGMSLISSEGLAFDIHQARLKEERRRENIPEF